MVKISAADVKKLRDMTGAGMMDCKKALQASEGDIEAAIEYLRKKGQKLAAKRADRAASEGAAIAKISTDASKGIAIVLSCETDFVAKNEDFVSFAHEIAELALDHFPASTEELLQLDLGGTVLSSRITEQIGKIGEKIEVSQYERLSSDAVVPYIHAGNKIGVLVGLNKNLDNVAAIGRDLAMQVAAMSPIAVDESEVAEATIAKELEIGREQALQEGKPDHLVDRIAQGKLKKFFKDSTLVNQQFVKDSSKTVKQFLSEVDGELKITGFKRIAIG